MQRPSAIAGSAIFFLAAPCVVAGVLPWLILGGYDRPFASTALAMVALPIIALATAALIYAFASFALEGGGTPAPVAPTDRLVVGGLYRHVRNPMYVAVLTIIAGQALMFMSMPVAIYAVLAGIAMVTFVHVYEEPTLAARYGSQYDAYRRAVPGWLPRLAPWRQAD